MTYGHAYTTALLVPVTMSLVALLPAVLDFRWERTARATGTAPAHERGAEDSNQEMKPV